jgi:predicted MFS family arabinose efflux permease
LRADELSRGRRLAIYLILLVASLAYNFSFILIDYIRPFLVRDLAMSLPQTALLYAAQGSGVIVGSFLMPVLVSRLGSRRMLMVSAAVLAAATGLNLLAADFAAWAVLRFCVGNALAGSYVASTTLLANFFPPRVRGRLLTANMAMFSIALLVAGSVGAAVGETGWRALVWIAALSPLMVAVLTLLALPDDRRYSVYADEDVSADSNDQSGSWREMLAGPRLRLTLGCLLLAGLNFSGYQFYSGFITTYLLNVRGFDAAVTGSFVTIDGAGTLLGSLLWGHVADRYGRRVNAWGFALAALFIGLFLVAPTSVPLLYALEFGYAVCLSAANCWAAYFAELFPVRLRPMGTSLFHGGHVISLAAPYVVATVSQHHTLGVGMALAPFTFVLAAVIWWSLPETLRSSRLYRGFRAEAAR